MSGRLEAAARVRSYSSFMTDALASRWSSAAATQPQRSAPAGAPDCRNSSGMRCRNLPTPPRLLIYSLNKTHDNTFYMKERVDRVKTLKRKEENSKK